MLLTLEQLALTMAKLKTKVKRKTKMKTKVKMKRRGKDGEEKTKEG